MAENKRYYWLKLKEDFFEDDTVQWLEEQENGKDYIIFYLKLALKSLEDNGSLMRYVGEKLIPYDVKALAKMTNTQPDTVSVAMKTFLEIGLISRFDTGEIYMNQINEMIGSETDSAKRVRKHRARKAIESTGNTNSLQCNTEVTDEKQEGNTEIELEKELEIDKDNKKTVSKKTKPKSKREKNLKRHHDYIFLTDQELKNLYEEYGNKSVDEMIINADEYIGMNGLQRKYKNHNKLIRNWLRRNGVKTLAEKRADYEQQFKSDSIET